MLNNDWKLQSAKTTGNVTMIRHFALVVAGIHGLGCQLVDSSLLLRTELYEDFCLEDLGATYETALNECYNGANLFNDEDWGTSDILDVVSHGKDNIMLLHRTFFASNTSVCSGPVDDYILPVDECVGPFGKPRPWGMFTLINTTNDDSMNDMVTYSY